ncbi:MAG: hypothetical protein M3464_17225 [Chloroflexota bacterium]|nr:hypothetical protein [Chloroflexota bacterium]
MDSQRFDRFTKTIANGASRRHLLRGVAGGVLAAAVAHFGGGTEAAAQVAAAARCFGNNKKCKRGTQCCSGICRKKKCRPAPQQGTCTIRKDTCKLTGGIGFGPKCNGVQGCECIVTKTGAAFCREIGGAACTSCFSNQDCAVAFGPNAKCIRGSTCGDPCGIGDFCAVPCGFESTSRQERGQ